MVLVGEKKVAIALKPVLESRGIFKLALRGLVGGQGLVRITVGEVIEYSKTDVFVSFNERRAQVLITMDDKEVSLVAKIGEGMPVRER
jgi:hypothetical protein